MNEIRANIIRKLVISGILAIIVLSIINVFYSYSGIHINNKTGATDYIWKKYQFKSTMTEGFSWMIFDKYGFNNVDAELDDIHILLMGSSHMEAYNIKKEENVGTLLESYLLDKNTYNIGTSGHTIYRCVDNIDNALSYYAPSEFVIIETDRVQLSIDEMDAVVEGTAEKIPSYDSGLIYQIQKIPAIKWMYKNFASWYGMSNQDVSQKANGVDMFQYRNSLEKFLGIVSNETKEQGCKPIIFYQPETMIDANGNLIESTDDEYLSLFVDACAKNDIIFVDMTDEFEQLYKEEHILAHGFSNTAVGVGHLNKYGHETIAAKLSEVINGLQENDEYGVE